MTLSARPIVPADDVEQLRQIRNACKDLAHHVAAPRPERDIRGMSDEQYWDAMADAQSY